MQSNESPIEVEEDIEKKTELVMRNEKELRSLEKTIVTKDIDDRGMNLLSLAL